MTLLLSPERLAVRAVLLAALGPHPEARVEAATRETGDAILVAPRTRELLTIACRFDERPGIQLKGKREPISLYAPMR